LRIAVVGALFLGLLASASAIGSPALAQVPESSFTPERSTEQPAAVEPQVPSPPTERTLSTTNNAAPPVQVELPLPPKVTRSINDTAVAASQIAEAINEIAGYLKPATLPPMHWWEQWAWGIAFAILAFAAMRLGFRDLNSSIALEREEAAARSLQEAFDGGDTTVEKQLRNIVDVATGKKKKPTKHPLVIVKRWSQRWLQEQPPAKWLDRQPWTPWTGSFGRMLGRRTVVRILMPKYWLFWVGGLMLLLLATTSDETAWLDDSGSPWFRFGLAKAAAWSVLDTNFAGAFAVTWIAVLFFWGLQSRRLVEAKTKLAVIIEEAKRTLKLAHKEAYGKYLAVIRAIEGQPVDPPRRPATKGQVDRERVKESDEEAADREEDEFQAFRLVRKAAFELAIGKPLLDDSELEDIESERERLSEYAPLFFFPVSRSLADFVALLRKRNRLPPDDVGLLWETVADGSSQEALDAISKLAGKMKVAKSS
jgi:hypothetical protein